MTRLQAQDNQECDVSEDDPTMTLPEFLEQQAELERDAAAMYPGRIDRCTYLHGSYSKKKERCACLLLNFAGYVCQSVFVCKTCPQTDPAGMCYSCSISCHADHTILELYSKRAFRCDCGNSKFKGEAFLSIPEASS